MKSTRWVITYIVVASLGLWGALFMSLKFMTPGRAQAPEAQQGSAQSGQPPAGQPQSGGKVEAPAPGDLPPEFLQETQNSPPPGSPNGAIPPPPMQTPTANEALPPPPAASAAEAEPSPEELPLPPGPPNMVPAGEPAGGGDLPMSEPAITPVVPKFASDDQYNYDPTGRRDPFKPYRAYRPSASNASSTKSSDEADPLQRWDLERFAVVAILWEVRQPKAMVQDPDGKMYMIGKKTKIGRNSGQVVAIREGEVVVVESVDNEGVQTKEVKILELKK